jgi:hypothetical protein
MVHDNHACPRDARPASVDRAEERAWIGFYERVDRDLALAIEIMALLDSEPDSKRRLLALYLSCKQSVRFHKAREARDRRIGELVRLLLRSMIVQPLSTATTLLARAADLLAACAPAGKTVARPSSRSATRSAEPTGDTASRNVQHLLRTSAKTEREGASQPPARAAEPPERNSTVTEGAAPTVSVRR